MDIKFIFIGCGAIGKTLIEIWNLEKLYIKNKITIIEPQPMPEWIFKGRNIHHINVGITENNAKDLLKDLDSDTLMIDLSVEVDSLMLIDFCDKVKCMYINTSLENWHEELKPMYKDYNQFKKDTLYHRELVLQNKLKKSNTTIVMDNGMNPGMIQDLALTSLDIIAGQRNIKFTDYAELAKQLDLISIQVVEYDSQKTNLEAYDDLFINSWSSLGFQAEGTDHCMFGYGTLDTSFEKYKLITPNEGAKNVRFIAEHSMDLKRKSVTLNPKGEKFEYEGMLITHGESNTLSRFLSTKDGSYRPSVYYVYRPSDISLECLEMVRKNKYQFLEYWHVMCLDDIESGFDSIGALLTFKDGSQFWGGTILEHEQVKKLGFKYGTATTVQVAGSVYSGIEWILDHQHEGFTTPEQMNHLEILGRAIKYLGNVYFKWI
jgi:homospermidine synthase